MNLKNKITLVTGASSGIGKSTAVALAKEGATVIIGYKSNDKSAEEVCDECNLYSKNNISIKADISTEDGVISLLNQIKEKFGHIDILVNNMGIFDDTDSPTNSDVFDKIYHHNFLSCVNVVKHSLPLMSEGKIVNVSSIHGRLGHGRPQAIAYSAFKAALDSYTKNLAKSVAPKILVNAIAPGRVLTPMWENPDEAEQKQLGEVHLIKRMIEPEEVADSIIFLIKNDAICGEVLTIDGGMSLVTLG